jgi:hypothetical protein
LPPILIAAAALILLDRVSPLAVLALVVPCALFGVGFLTTNLVFHKEADFIGATSCSRSWRLDFCRF